MSTPIDTLFKLNDATQDLDMTQALIDSARAAASSNQQLQLELDRRQSILDDKRAMIERIKRHIAMSN